LSDSLEVQVEAERVRSSSGPEHSEPIQTRTMAELFVQQGSIGKAIEIFRQLASLDPDDALLRARLAELEGGGHWFHQESPGSFESAVKWFLNSI